MTVAARSQASTSAGKEWCPDYLSASTDQHIEAHASLRVRLMCKLPLGR